MNEQWGPPIPFDVRYAQVRVADLKGRVIRCPAFNANTLSIYDWVWAPELSKARKPRFMKALRESIAAEGIRNPLCAYATDEGLFLSFGGSRALAAREMGLETIPCIVNDYSGAYSDSDIVTLRNVESFFTDVPAYYDFTDYGFDMHYSMERNRRGTFDPAGIAWADNIDDRSFFESEFSWIMSYTQKGKDNG